MSKVLWEWIPNVGSKARECMKAMILAFVLLDFQHVGVRRAWCTRRSVDMQQFREVSRTKTIYSTETHTSDFILNTFWNGKPEQFFQERCWVVVMGCQEAVQAVSSLGWGWRDFLNLGPYTHQPNALPWDLTGRESSHDKLLNPGQKEKHHHPKTPYDEGLLT